MSGRMSLGGNYHDINNNDKQTSSGKNNLFSSSDMLLHTFKTIDVPDDLKVNYLRTMIKKLREISKFRTNLLRDAQAPMDMDAYMEILKKKEEISLKKTNQIIITLTNDFQDLCKSYRKEKKQTLHAISTIRGRVNQYSDKWGWGKKEIVEAALESYQYRIEMDPEDTTDSAIEELRKMRQEIQVSLLNEADRLLSVFSDCKKAAKAVAKYKAGFDEGVVDAAWVGVIEKLKEEPMEQVMEYLEDMLEKLRKMRTSETKIKVQKVNKLLELVDDSDSDDDDLSNIKEERRRITRDIHLNNSWKTGRLSLDLSCQNHTIYEEDDNNEYDEMLELDEGNDNFSVSSSNRDSGSTVDSFQNNENVNDDSDSDSDSDDDGFQVDNSSLLELYPEKITNKINSHKTQEKERAKEKQRFSNALNAERERKKKFLARIQATKQKKKIEAQRYREALEKGNKNSRRNSTRNSLPCDPRASSLRNKTESTPKSSRQPSNEQKTKKSSIEINRTPKRRTPLQKKNMNNSLSERKSRTSRKKKGKRITSRASIYDFRMNSPGAVSSKTPFTPKGH